MTHYRDEYAGVLNFPSQFTVRTAAENVVAEANLSA
jgi:hypothetical protein